MAFDTDALTPGVDLDAVDFASLDRGDTLPEPAAVEPEKKEPAAAAVEPEKKEPAAAAAEPEKKAPAADPAAVAPAAAEPAAGDPAAEPEKKDQPRDEKGRYVDARIPKARFDEAVGKEREAREAAERRAQAAEQKLLEQQQSQQRTEDLTKLDTQLADLEKQLDTHILDGEVEKAQAVRSQIRQLNRVISRAESQQEASVIVGREMEQQRVEATIARLEADHPVLNPASEEFDPDIVQMIVLAQESFVASGIPPSQALNDAANRVVSKLNKLRTPAPAEPAEEKKPSLEDATPKPDDRTKNAVQKALDTQTRQPASLKEAGLDSDKLGLKALPDANNLSVEEFAALPEATRARMRGDLL